MTAQVSLVITFCADSMSLSVAKSIPGIRGSNGDLYFDLDVAANAPVVLP